MASRMARTAVGAARLRPALPRTLPAVGASLITSRSASNVPAEDPKKKAQSILDSLPGNSLISKAAILSAGAGVSVAAISNELYVLNEESITMLCTLGVFAAIAHYGGPMYSEWATGQIDKLKGILNSARNDHTTAVKQRIESVQQLGGVVEVTKQLFAVSKVRLTDMIMHKKKRWDSGRLTNPKETAQLEAKAFELEQNTALVQEAKSVLDSWVRYEGQVKQRQQRELAETVIAKIQKELENPKTLQQILNQSVADVERIVASKSQ
ncbi:MAG: atp4 subunit B of the stator stalk of mitochondrial F1F0 ATP synthase [Sarea resinae]|nr:MAG: atp4 subunit B of the stator stalk of mitochondrial F1F0 ATP synthase [Sarea resinae]